MKVELKIQIENPNGSISTENIKNILVYINENILNENDKFHEFSSITRNQSNLNGIIFSVKCKEQKENLI